MARTKADIMSRGSKGSNYGSGMGYKGVLRRGSKYGFKYEDGRICKNEGGFDTAEEAAYAYDEFITAYSGGTGDTNQSLGLLKQKYVIQIREKLTAAQKPASAKVSKRGSTGFKGVSSNKSKKKPFRCQIMVKGKSILIGSSDTAEECARLYDAWVLQHLGADHETNVSLGLLPPLEMPVFKAIEKKPAPQPVEDEQPEITMPARGYETRINYADPDKERLAQIEAARLMAALDSDENQEEEESEGLKASLSPDSAPLPAPCTHERAPLQPEQQPAVVEEELSPLSLPPCASMPSVVASPAELVAQAAALIQQAANQQRDDFREKCLGLIDNMSVEVESFQAAVLTLIDRGAAMEKAIAELRRALVE